MRRLRAQAKGLLYTTIVLVSPLAAQTLQVYSEFRRVDARGEILAADRAGKPREILSPAVVRNAFASFRVVASSPAGQPFTLYIGQNPDTVFQLTAYREILGPGGIPDRLEPVKLPYTYHYASRAEPISQSFWLDIWAPINAPVRRIRVEAQ